MRPLAHELSHQWLGPASLAVGDHAHAHARRIGVHDEIVQTWSRREVGKDIGLAMHAVKSTGSSAPLGSHAAEIYAKFAADHTDKDFSAVIEMIRKG
jgi:3-hydroxyisobutyrate dehydrogenase-like beta-hydroxyacid dehydrogenase